MAKKKELVLQGWCEVGPALREVRDINLRVRRAETIMNNAITDLKTSYEERVCDDLTRREELLKDIELFTKANINDFTDKKTREFTFGKVGFRKSTEIITRNVKAILEALKQNKMFDCINIKESIDKDMLGKYDDEALKKIGAKRKESDKYFVEIEMEELI